MKFNISNWFDLYSASNWYMIMDYYVSRLGYFHYEKQNCYIIIDAIVIQLYVEKLGWRFLTLNLFFSTTSNQFFFLKTSKYEGIP